MIRLLTIRGMLAVPVHTCLSSVLPSLPTYARFYTHYGSCIEVVTKLIAFTPGPFQNHVVGQDLERILAQWVIFGELQDGDVVQPTHKGQLL